MRVGIIGGTGKMGTFFRQVWEKEGHEVQISGRKTSRNSRDLARECDMVVVSVPIRNTVGVIEEIASVLTDQQILCDLTSLKMKPVEAMLRSSAEVIGLHPMFGPGIASLQGQTIIACPVRCRKETADEIFCTFAHQGARVVITTPEEHDRMMAVIQGLTHFSTLCMAETMRRIGIDIDEALRCTSPVYRIEIGLIGRLLGQDPNLYADMLTMNPFVPAVLKELQEVAWQLGKAIEKGDRSAFQKFFMENAEAFARYRDQATQETDDIIEFLVKR
jgi:prephenate dehydrogenase